MKICSECKIEQDDGCFNIGRLKCKTCQNIYKKKYRELNKEKIIKEGKAYYQANKEIIKFNSNMHYHLNIEKIKERNKVYYSNNKERYLKASRKFKIEKRKTDPNFKLRTNISRAILTQLIKNNSAKNNCSCFKYLPYSVIELRKHLENQFDSWMSWNNYGVYNLKFWDDNNCLTWKWNIDHIIPQSKLIFDSMEHPNFKKCWALENLRPLSAKQNIIKGNRSL